MKPLTLKRSAIAFAILFALPFVTGADGNGCGGDVSVGDDDPCFATGCSGTVCSDEDVATTCEWNESYACYGELGICERGTDGACGWRATAELEDCLVTPEPAPCVETGCSGQICAETDTASTCEWQDSYACYQDLGVCERNADGACAWRDSDELAACLADPRTPVDGACIKNSGDACTTDADCTSGGCGGELCFNPAVSEGVSTCECTAPVGPGCGCVSGACTWFE